MHRQDLIVDRGRVAVVEADHEVAVGQHRGVRTLVEVAGVRVGARVEGVAEAAQLSRRPADGLRSRPGEAVVGRHRTEDPRAAVAQLAVLSATLLEAENGPGHVDVVPVGAVLEVVRVDELLVVEHRRRVVLGHNVFPAGVARDDAEGRRDLVEVGSLRALRRGRDVEQAGVERDVETDRAVEAPTAGVERDRRVTAGIVGVQVPGIALDRVAVAVAWHRREVLGGVQTVAVRRQLVAPGQTVVVREVEGRLVPPLPAVVLPGQQVLRVGVVVGDVGLGLAPEEAVGVDPLVAIGVPLAAAQRVRRDVPDGAPSRCGCCGAAATTNCHGLAGGGDHAAREKWHLLRDRRRLSVDIDGGLQHGGLELAERGRAHDSDRLRLARGRRRLQRNRRYHPEYRDGYYDSFHMCSSGKTMTAVVASR